MDNKVKDAMQILVEALQKDKGYRISWQANIAMAFKDEYYRCRLKYKTKQDIHKIANKASDYFLDLLCNDTQKNDKN